MSWEDFGGPYNLNDEAHRLAYMLNGAANPHLAAAELSQDLYGLPTRAAVNLIRRTQAYEDPYEGAHLVVNPVVAQTWYGPVDTGQRDVRVVGEGINDQVAVLRATPQAFRPYLYPYAENRIDPFAAIEGLMIGALIGGRDRNWWRECGRQDRDFWRDRDDWRQYDGKHNGWHPDHHQVHEYNRHNAQINHMIQDNPQNFYDTSKIAPPHPIYSHIQPPVHHVQQVMPRPAVPHEIRQPQLLAPEVPIHHAQISHPPTPENQTEQHKQAGTAAPRS